MPARKTIFPPEIVRSKIFINSDNYYKDNNSPKRKVYFIWCDNMTDLYAFCVKHYISTKNIHGSLNNGDLHVYVTYTKMTQIRRYCHLAEKYDKLEFDLRKAGKPWLIPHVQMLRETRFLGS